MDRNGVIYSFECANLTFAGGKGYRCASAKIHHFKILKDGKSLLDMIPVKKGGYVLMYDKVSKKLFDSASSRKFLIVR